MATHAIAQSANGLFSGLPAVQAALARQSKAYLRAYGDIIDVYDGIAQSWIERRRAGVNSALSAVDSLSQAGTAQDSVRIYNEWVFEALRRFNDEILTLGEQLASAQAKALESLESQASAMAEEVRTAGETAAQAVRDSAEAVAHGTTEATEQRLAS